MRLWTCDFGLGKREIQRERGGGWGGVGEGRWGSVCEGVYVCVRARVRVRVRACMCAHVFMCMGCTPANLIRKKTCCSWEILGCISKLETTQLHYSKCFFSLLFYLCSYSSFHFRQNQIDNDIEMIRLRLYKLHGCRRDQGCIHPDLKRAER